ncbi:restriction endonuclease [Streptomyces sp. ISL-100]|uniref:Lsr2 family DNA-binding protein n=1 Tax=Streptomyces sp. ISL-100 TaxID=2819173 RepID=UPI001BE63727|nr:restriction endonuclease [Streptomyces sp. ISL-100]MBT2398084.1 restriction endonuclease [Streptomyces sp. ISL-100]
MSSPWPPDQEGFPAPLPWLTRAGASPHVPGSPLEIISNLRTLLAGIAKDGTIDRPFTSPNADSPIPLRKAVHALGACGLVKREGRPSRLSLTDEASYFLESGDELYLIAVFHANVRFVGEVLASLGEGLAHNELNEVAAKEYGLRWDSLDQVRRRVYWLRAAGLVDYWTNGKVVPTERGLRFLERLELVTPDQLPHRRRTSAQAVELPPPPALLAVELADADQAALRSRKRPLGYVAGGARVEVLARLVNAAVPEITRSDFRSFCTEEFGVLGSSAEQTLGTLRSFGLLAQVGTDTFAATELAASCLASDEALDFVRLLHLNIALLGETLEALEDESHSSTLLRVLAERYPHMQLTREDVTRRLALLLDTGLAERIGLAVRRTELGTTLVHTLPLLEHANSDELASTDDVVVRGESAAEARATADAGRRSFGLLATEVVQAATDSADHQRFERAVAAAFRALGVDVETHGGPKKTDVVIELWQSPTDRQRVAVEAKTDGAGLVTDQDVKFWRLGEHRERHEARSTVLVGPRFDARVVQEAAREKVALLTARELANAVMRHSRTPLTPREITAMVTAGNAEALALTWRAAERRQEALSLVLHTLWKSGNDPVDIQYTTGVLGVSDIWRETKGALETPLDSSEIEEALAFLGAPFIAGVARQGGDHVVTAPPSLIAARLRALASVIESAGEERPTGGHGGEEPPTPPARPGPEPSVPRQQEPPTNVTASLVRTWAKSQGRAINERGRLPQSLIKEYMQAHGRE